MSLHLIVGAGPVGTSTARHLATAGHDVVVVSRSGTDPGIPGVVARAVDALDAAALTAVAAGATTIYNAANPPYTKWAELWPPLAASILTAAASTGAGLVTMSNLYGYRIDGPMSEDTPLDPAHAKGLIRTRMWDEALTAAEAGRIPSAVEARASDFFGPGVEGSVVGYAMPAILGGKKARVLGRTDVAHSLTYIDDVGRTLAVLGTDERARNRVWHVPTAPARTQAEAFADLARAAGAPPPRLSPTPVWMLRAMGLFVKDLGEMVHVVEQYEKPFVIDASACTSTFGIEPTPWDDAVAATASWWSAGARTGSAAAA